MKEVEELLVWVFEEEEELMWLVEELVDRTVAGSLKKSESFGKTSYTVAHS